MKKASFIVTTVASLLFITSCSSRRHNQEKPHHHHQSCSKQSCDKKHECEMFNKKCAASVSHGDFHVEGKDDYKLEHGGHTYFFSSKEKMKEFQAHLDTNVQKANEQWNRFQGPPK